MGYSDIYAKNKDVLGKKPNEDRSCCTCFWILEAFFICKPNFWIVDMGDIKNFIGTELRKLLQKNKIKMRFFD